MGLLPIMLPVMWQNDIMHIMHFEAYYFTARFQGDGGMLLIKMKQLRERSYSILWRSLSFSCHALKGRICTKKKGGHKS
jgi:hypothetical protein